MRDVLEFWIQCRCSKWPPLASKHCESRRTAAWTTFCNVSSVIAAHNVVMFSHRSSRAIWGWKLLPTIRWRSTPLPSRCQDVSGWNSTWTTDRSKRCCWVSTTVSGSNTSRFLPMGVPKDDDYRRKSATLDDLRENITMSCAAVTLDTLQNVVHAAVGRLRRCLDADGGHFEHLHWIQNSRTSLISILILYKYSS